MKDEEKFPKGTIDLPYLQGSQRRKTSLVLDYWLRQIRNQGVGQRYYFSNNFDNVQHSKLHPRMIK
jgi:hypothetical protein